MIHCCDGLPAPVPKEVECRIVRGSTQLARTELARCSGKQPSTDDCHNVGEGEVDVERWGVQGRALALGSTR